MKRIFKGLLILLAMLSLSTGCIKRDDMENITIHTTVYPITYIINCLYGNYSTISSIYPNDIDVKNYELVILKFIIHYKYKIISIIINFF